MRVCSLRTANWQIRGTGSRLVDSRAAGGDEFEAAKEDDDTPDGLTRTDRERLAVAGHCRHGSVAYLSAPKGRACDDKVRHRWSHLRISFEAVIGSSRRQPLIMRFAGSVSKGKARVSAGTPASRRCLRVTIRRDSLAPELSCNAVISIPPVQKSHQLSLRARRRKKTTSA